MDGDNMEKLTLQDYEAEGLCSGCMFYGAVDVDKKTGREGFFCTGHHIPRLHRVRQGRCR